MEATSSNQDSLNLIWGFNSLQVHIKQQLLLCVSICVLLSSLFWLCDPLFSFFFPCFLLLPVKLLPAFGPAFLVQLIVRSRFRYAQSHDAGDASVYQKRLGFPPSHSEQAWIQKYIYTYTYIYTPNMTHQCSNHRFMRWGQSHPAIITRSQSWYGATSIGLAI
jgi:hypothetical protein